MIFSVIDVETTGLSPLRGDRVLEIGIARLDEDGRVLDVFDTLVDPERTVMATHVHGITEEMVAGAPKFRDLLPLLSSIVEGTVLSAHNASFDFGFIREEFRRAGAKFPEVTPVCTLILARRYLKNLPSRSLGACRAYLNLPDTGAHNALADARSAAFLLRHMIERYCPEISARPYRSSTADRSGGLFDDEWRLKPRTAAEDAR
jgi:DNA polymerase III epsilon subunit family exonuclease